MDRKAHWESVYRAKDEREVSWYQRRPGVSLEMIEAVGLAPDEPLIDVGGGASTLVDALLEAGFTDLTVLDIAEPALAAARARLGGAASKVTWIAADVTAFAPERRYSLWHDRAVFHFLTDAADRERYADTVDRALADDGEAIIATFSRNGPRQCSGLDVVQYDGEAIAAELGPRFTLVEERAETHRTPAGGEQSFAWFRFRRA